MAQIFVRIIKFNIRGFVITEETKSKIQSTIIECIPTMTKPTLKQYIVTQILSKHRGKDEKVAALKSFKEFFSLHKFDETYKDYFRAIVSEIEGELQND